MKHILTMAALAATAATLAPQQATATNNPDWLRHAVFYQIYPTSFQDSDGDGIGDLAGIESRLDYLKDLGVTALWLNPVFVSGWTDGGYDVIDFYRIDKRFGTNNDMVRLAKACHDRGMKICLDLVAGHTSTDCQWFKQSWEDSNLQYSDYYIWFNDLPAAEKDNVISDMKANDFATLLKRYVEANAPRAKYYEKNFYPTQPALNYGYANPDPNHPWEQPVTAPGPQATRREMRNIMQFWFDKGIDGFRVDMAASLVKNDPDKKATIALWHEMREWIDKNYPECVLISEWANPPQAISAGYNVDFMIHFGVNGYPSMFFELGTPNGDRNTDTGMYTDCYFNKAGKGSIKLFVDNYTNSYSKTKGQGFIAIPTANHDFQRANIKSRNTVDQLKVCMTFFMTMPGVPFIYYGDEIGMKFIEGLQPKEGSDTRTGTRTPMQWTREESAGFSTAAPDKLYLPIDTEGGKISVEAEQGDPNSMLNYTKQLLALRKSSAALGNEGEWELLSSVDQPYPMVYRRYQGDEEYVIVLNPSAKAVSATLPAQGGKPELIIGSKAQGSYKPGKTNDKVNVKGVSALIFKINK